MAFRRGLFAMVSPISLRFRCGVLQVTMKADQHTARVGGAPYEDTAVRPGGDKMRFDFAQRHAPA